MNIAFIDGQNLHLGTQSEGWKIDLYKFRIFLKDKYKIKEAYYFLGFLDEENQDLYNDLQKAGFIVTFREHNKKMQGTKKGNVDTDIVFEVMKNLIENDEMEKVVLVSGDGDYKKMVDYLIKKGVFFKLLFPNKRFASSLYKKLGSEFYDYIRNSRVHLEYKE
jgi:uncharacterized LabA/DUF88 family protein